MRFRSLVITGSLLANAALAALLAVRVSHGATSTAPTARPSAITAPPVTSPLADPETWRRLDAAEPADFIAHLRAEGFPPAVIRAMAAAMVDERFRARHQAIAEAAAANRPYWRPFANDPKLNAANRALNREESAMLQQLLGPEALDLTADKLAFLQHRYGNLPSEKLAQLQKIIADYDDMMAEVHEATNEIILPEDRAKLALLQKERDADAGRLFTPDELTEYELHHSSTANRLLQQLSAFDPTEAEFRALFALNHAVDTEYGNPGVLSVEQRRVRSDALKQLAPQIEAALGPERYADYQQAIDPNYQQMFQLVTSLELPRTAAAQVVAVQKDIQQRTNALTADATLTPEQRQVQFAALNQEATAKLTASLGAAGLEAYKNGPGYWLQNLQQFATTPAAPKQ
jgi:hypothetical protein